MTGIIRVKPDFPPMLAYDRYGQGLTEDRDPQDTGREVSNCEAYFPFYSST